jgi:hypothetical protein
MGCGDASPSTCSDEHSLPVGFLEHANNFQPSDLVVVDDIRWQPTSDGNFKARGGRLRIWSDWTPLKEDLASRKFAYSLSEVRGSCLTTWRIAGCGSCPSGCMHSDTR